jgi:hypothetical protein
MRLLAHRLRAAICLLGLCTAVKSAYGVNKYGYECVTNYTGANGVACTAGGGNIPNRCTNAQGLANQLASAGATADNTWADVNVYDTDTMDSDIVSGGTDALYTDTNQSNVFMWSMHGNCNNLVTTTNCTTDAQCATGYRCFNLGNANRCVGYVQRQILPCSTGDSNNHIVTLDTQVRLGEFTDFAGAGRNGNMNVAIFDTSCSVEMHFFGNAAPIFAGLHMMGGYAGYYNPWPSALFGDINDNANRGTFEGNRFISHQAIGDAHVDTTRLDDPVGLNARACVISTSCARTNTAAQNHLHTEKWPTSDADDEVISPTICAYTYWCDF